MARSKGRADRDIGGVSAASDDDASDARRIVPGVERVPLVPGKFTAGFVAIRRIGRIRIAATRKTVPTAGVLSSTEKTRVERT
jgi:hypothetical protein